MISSAGPASLRSHSAGGERSVTTHLTLAPGHLLLLSLALKINEGLLGAARALQLLSCWGDALLGGSIRPRCPRNTVCRAHVLWSDPPFILEVLFPNSFNCLTCFIKSMGD